MGISRQFLSTRTNIIPGRLWVKVWERVSNDRWLEAFSVLAEKRNVNQPGSSSDGIESSRVSWVFNVVELKGKVVAEGCIIQNGEEFWSVESTDGAILDQRLHCAVVKGDDPRSYEDG